MTAAGELRERLVIAAIGAGWDPGTAVPALRVLEEFIVGEKAEAGHRGSGIRGAVPIPDPCPLTPAPAKAGRPSPAEEAAPSAAAPAKAKKWTPERIGEFTEMWNAGISAAEIGKRFDLTPGSAYQQAKKLGLPPRRRRLERKLNAVSTRAAPATPVKAPSPPLPGTSELPAAAIPDGPVGASVERVIGFLQSRDIVVLPDPKAGRVARWKVNGRRGGAMTSDALLDYANKERKRIGKQPFYYGL